MRSLIAWARSELGIERIGVRVLSDNPALGFYVKFGFREVQRVPLVPSHEGDSVAWEPAPGATGAKRELVHMELS
jgi:RimJ/RimL family protein N-acetyltransferase